MEETAAMESASAWPKVSVVIPTFNRAHLLPEAIKSVLLQGYPNLEIIVVDDGSTDQTESVARSHEPLVRYVRQENAGPAAARNLGMMHCTGEFVAFLDSDDLFLPGKLHEQVQYFRQRPQTVLVYCWYEVIDGAGRRRVGRRCRLAGHAGRKLLAQCMQGPLATPTVVARRSALLAAGGFDPSMRLSEDIDLWCRVARLGPIGLVPEILVSVRRLGDGASRGPSRCAMLAASRRILEKAFITDGSFSPVRRLWLHAKALLWSWLVAAGRRLPSGPSFWLRAMWTNPLATLRAWLSKRSSAAAHFPAVEQSHQKATRKAA
jgi:glycosyltransferase involved in cell wall biosynthesis